MPNENLFRLLEQLEREYPECKEANRKMKKKIQKIMTNSEIEAYFKSKNKYLVHILELVRNCQMAEDKIAEELIQLFREGKIAFAFQGDYPICGGVNEWTEEEWKESQNPGSILHTFLKSNYRAGIKKKELESVRNIMRKIQSEISSIKLNWGYVRYKGLVKSSNPKSNS